MRSLKFPSDDATAAAKDSLYVEEVTRQAEIADGAIMSALRRGPDVDAHDAQVWASLQAALFAAICVVRLLRPVGVRWRPQGGTSAQAQSYSDDRGARLREYLEIPDDSTIFSVAAIRNSFEHFDERVDERMTAGAVCVSDWYISDGLAAVTSTDGQPPTGVGLRVFYPTGGLLFFDNEFLDLYAIDIELLNIRISAKTTMERLKERIKGRGLFGGQSLRHLLDPGKAIDRTDEWLRVRQQAIRDLNSNE